ncbi:hypothetical protein MMC18_002846 [Xylographa bjoerkii]|nr:hypothetical protein [Xylographa bjoerkii]
MLLFQTQLCETLRKIEVEDTLPNQQLWVLEDMCDRLSAIPSLEQIEFGFDVLGNSYSTLYSIQCRSRNKITSRLRQLMALKKQWKQESYIQRDPRIVAERKVQQNVWSQEAKACLAALRAWLDAEPGIYKAWENLKSQDISQRVNFSLNIGEMPKVRYIHFKKRALYQQELEKGERI